MTSRRILFVLEPFPFPSGGVAVTLRHAEILAAHGLPAYVLMSRQPEIDFYGSSAPLIVHGGSIGVQPGDIFVIPEGFEEVVRLLAQSSARRLMFCQNHYYLPFPVEPGKGIGEFGVHGVIASSEAVRAFFRDVYGVTDLPLIPYAVDPVLHAPAPAKRRQIACMPFKLPKEGKFIHAVFGRLHARFAGVPWVFIEGKSRRDAAAVLAESEVFLSLSNRESFGLPPLEAMACGCLVAGFHGEGGREYMTPENGWWAETGDWRACVSGLAAALELLDAGGVELAARRRAMQETVMRYSPERMEAALLDFWRAELQKPFPR